MNQNILLNIAHLYSEQYGWTDDYTLNNVYLDDHILREKIIKQQKQQDLTIQTNIALLPLIQNNDDRKKLIESYLYIEQKKHHPEINENITLEETKKQIEEAKREMQNL